MRLRESMVATVFGLLAALATLSAQQTSTPPLGDVAREAEAAKATARKAKKTYTNADLTADPRGESAPAAPPPSNGFMSASLGRVVTPEEVLKRSEEKAEKDAVTKEPEEQWRNRAESIRKQVAELQKRRDDLRMPSALRDGNPISKLQNDREIANADRGLEALQRQWDRLEASAKDQKANPAWLEPRPRF